MTTTFIIIVVYFLVIIGIGFISRTQAMKSAEDYFVAGRTLGTFAVTMGIPATLFSAFSSVTRYGLQARNLASLPPRSCLKGVLTAAGWPLLFSLLWLFS